MPTPHKNAALLFEVRDTAFRPNEGDAMQWRVGCPAFTLDTQPGTKWLPPKSEQQGASKIR